MCSVLLIAKSTKFVFVSGEGGAVVVSICHIRIHVPLHCNLN